MKKLKSFLSKHHKAVFVIIIIALLLSFGLGFLSGVSATIKGVIYVSKSFMNVSINEDLVNRAIFQYQNKMKGCFPDL